MLHVMVEHIKAIIFFTLQDKKKRERSAAGKSTKVQQTKIPQILIRHYREGFFYKQHSHCLHSFQVHLQQPLVDHTHLCHVLRVMNVKNVSSRGRLV